jgi:para-nitrobenzyl esterase
MQAKKARRGYPTIELSRTRPEVRTSPGRVRGVLEGRTAVFRGIPFAAPPVGTLRFAAPQAPRPWEGVLDAASFGPIPPQAPDPDAEQWPPPHVDGGRGCLTANVWTTEGSGGKPVLVWIYGGGYLAGHSADALYDGSVLAGEGGVVVVTFNYRLGAEGFGQIDGAPANRGLLDQVAALEWVRDNAAAFGGDPARVTVFGQSAGAGAVAALLAMPRAAGLFQRAIAQSVPGMFFSTELAADIMATITGSLGRAATVQDLRDVPSADLAAASGTLDLRARAERWGVVSRAPMPYAPVVDGEVLPTTPWRALRAGASRDVELLVGHNRDEFRRFVLRDGLREPVTDRMAQETLLAFAPDADAYRAAAPDASPGRLVELVQSDWLFRMPSLHLARDHAGRSHLYELTVEAPAQGGALGSCHGLDIPLVFGNLHGNLARKLLGEHPPAEITAISAAMRSAWIAFAHGRAPGWAEYDEAGTTWVITTEPAAQPYPERTSATLWTDHDFAPLPLRA